MNPQGKEQMALILKQAQPILDTRLMTMVQQVSLGPEACTQAFKKIGEWLSRLKDPVGRAVRLQSLQKQLEPLGFTKKFLLEVLTPLQTLGKSPRERKKTEPLPLVPSISSSFYHSGAFQKSVLNVKISKGDQILLKGLAWGGDFSKIFIAAQSQLPPGQELSALFDYGPARCFIVTLFEKVLKEEEELSWIPKIHLNWDLDVQVRITLTEALLLNAPSISLELFRCAVSRKLGKMWFGFSQVMKKSLCEAETQQNAASQMQLMKEYLDVQRKMKEFNNFYDEE